MLLRDRLRGNLRTIVRPPHDEISLRFCREATHPRLRTCRRPRIQRVRLCPTCLFSRQERLVPPMRLFIVAFCRLEKSLSYCWVKGWLVGAVGIGLKATLKTRKLLILLNGKNAKNTGFAKVRYTPGTRNSRKGFTRRLRETTPQEVSVRVRYQRRHNRPQGSETTVRPPHLGPQIPNSLRVPLR